MDFANFLNPQAPTVQPQPQGLGQVVAPQGAPQAPMDPVQQQQRASSFNQMLDDPNFKSALFRFGLQTMRGQQAGETVLGSLANNAMDAMDYYAAKNELDRKKAIEDQKNALEKQNVESQVASRTATTAATVQDTAQKGKENAEWAANADMRSKKANAELEKALTGNKLESARLAVEQFKIDEAKALETWKQQHPEAVEADFQAKMKESQKKIDELDARIKASNASAAHSNAETAKTQAEIKQLNTLPPMLRNIAANDHEAGVYALARKGAGATDQEIYNDILAGKHKGTTSQGQNYLEVSGAGPLQLQGTAKALSMQYDAEVAKLRNSGKPVPTIEQWITSGQSGMTVTPGKTLEALLQAVNTERGAAAGAAPAAATPTAPTGNVQKFTMQDIMGDNSAPSTTASKPTQPQVQSAAAPAPAVSPEQRKAARIAEIEGKLKAPDIGTAINQGMLRSGVPLGIYERKQLEQELARLRAN